MLKSGAHSDRMLCLALHRVNARPARHVSDVAFNHVMQLDLASLALSHRQTWTSANMMPTIRRG